MLCLLGYWLFNRNKYVFKVTIRYTILPYRCTIQKYFQYNEDIIKFNKLKGWITKPPIYPESPMGIQENLDATEAFHLWDHLSARYDALEITQLFQNYTMTPNLRPS